MKLSKLLKHPRTILLLSIFVLTFLLALPVAAMGAAYDFASPIFGLTNGPRDSLLVADAGAGIVQIKGDSARLLFDLPEVTDMSQSSRGLFAITGLGDTENSNYLFVSQGTQMLKVSDLWAFEENVNPDGGEIDSNPFDVEALSPREALIADAGANALLIADVRGNVDWIATLPNELVSTANIKDLAGCPDPLPGFEFACDLPEMIPGEGVPTSVAVGPDGAYYVGELKGFPAPTGESRIWRIEPGARHAVCGADPACSVVADGFTSIVDLVFGPRGTLYVVELDEASWAAVEFGVGSVGGTVNACDHTTWNCHEVAAGLPIPIAVALDRQGQLFAAVSALIPGGAEIIALP